MDMVTNVYALEEEAVPGVAIQVVGWFLIISSAFMFIKHTLIRTIDHLLHVNILVASAGFLVADWALLLPGVVGCELFTFTFFVFGSAGTFTTAAIALERYRKMLRMSTTLPERKWQYIQLFGVWFSSLLLIAYPCFQKIRLYHIPDEDEGSEIDEDSETPEVFYDIVCMFSNSMMYVDSGITISFGIFSVAMPLVFMIFCYIRIFKHVRSVRINRWLNHVAAQRSRQACVIKSHGRKANVFQVHTTPIVSSDRNFDTIAYSRERSILLKGVFSMCVVIASWVPCSSLFIYLSTNGFDDHYEKYLKYVIIITKLSVPMNIIHYICFNVRYRKLYGQSLLGVFKRMCPTYSNETVDNTSLADSHIVPTSQCYREAILSTQPTGLHVLAPIIEPPTSRNPSGNNVLTTGFIQSAKRPITPARQGKLLMRTKSMPMCLKRSGAVAPLP